MGEEDFLNTDTFQLVSCLSFFSAPAFLHAFSTYPLCHLTLSQSFIYGHVLYVWTRSILVFPAVLFELMYPHKHGRKTDKCSSTTEYKASVTTQTLYDV